MRRCKTVGKATQIRPYWTSGYNLGSLAWSGDGRTIAYLQGPAPIKWSGRFQLKMHMETSDPGATPTFPTALLDRDTT